MFRYISDRLFRARSALPCLLLLSASPVLLLSASPVLAGNAPKELYNKTVTVVWEEDVRERTLEGRTLTPHNTQRRVIYISSLGRTFVRSNSQNRNSAKQREIAPGSTGSGTFSFNGKSMTGVAVNGGVARQVQASFDSSFSSCSANVTVGKTSASVRWTSMDGTRQLIVDEVKVGSTSCAIADGNNL